MDSKKLELKPEKIRNQISGVCSIARNSGSEVVESVNILVFFHEGCVHFDF